MTPASPQGRSDVVVVGAGHNGLVAATLLARAGLSVTVLERADVVGGACRTETPFDRVPGLRASTGAYLLGLMPPELMATLGLTLPLVRRDPHYFLPTADRRYLLLGADRQANARLFAEFFTQADAAADAALSAELDALRADLAPVWLTEPVGVEQTADRWVRPSLQQAFIDLVTGSAVNYLNRFGFVSEEVVAMYATTDGMPGLAGSPLDPGSGHNLLVHSMCRLAGAGGTWMVVRGGMGTVTGSLAQLASEAGATIRTGVTVERVTLTSGAVDGVALADGTTVSTSIVLLATDPYRLPGLVGADAVPPELAARIDGWATMPGRTLKINLATRGLPVFAALPEPRGQHGTTVHLLPPAVDGSVLTAIDLACRTAADGRLPYAPHLEWYLHSELDPSLQDADGHHSSAFFVQGVPHEVTDGGWATHRDSYVEHLLALAETYVPGLREQVVDVAALAPPDIEAHFGITGGHIFHVDNSVALDARMPYATGIAGLYAGAAGCHPAGSVIGAAGHNAARRVLADLDASGAGPAVTGQARPRRLGG